MQEVGGPTELVYRVSSSSATVTQKSRFEEKTCIHFIVCVCCVCVCVQMELGIMADARHPCTWEAEASLGYGVRKQ